VTFLTTQNLQDDRWEFEPKSLPVKTRPVVDSMQVQNQALQSLEYMQNCREVRFLALSGTSMLIEMLKSVSCNYEFIRNLPVSLIIKLATRTDTSGGECKPDTVKTFGRIANKIVDRNWTLPGKRIS
jgi:hypothetical protein